MVFLLGRGVGQWVLVGGGGGGGQMFCKVTNLVMYIYTKLGSLAIMPDVIFDVMNTHTHTHTHTQTHTHTHTYTHTQRKEKKKKEKRTLW